MINCLNTCLSFTAEHVLAMSRGDQGVNNSVCLRIRRTSACDRNISVLCRLVTLEIKDIQCKHGVSMKTKRDQNVFQGHTVDKSLKKCVDSYLSCVIRVFA